MAEIEETLETQNWADRNGLYLPPAEMLEPRAFRDCPPLDANDTLPWLPPGYAWLLALVASLGAWGVLWIVLT